MQNKYAKACAKCQGMVAPYQGVCEKSGGRWIVEHIECHTPTVNQRVELDMGRDVAQPSDHPAFRTDDGEPLFAWIERDMEDSLF